MSEAEGVFEKHNNTTPFEKKKLRLGPKSLISMPLLVEFLVDANRDFYFMEMNTPP